MPRRQTGERLRSCWFGRPGCRPPDGFDSSPIPKKKESRAGVVCLSVKGQLKMVVKVEIKWDGGGVLMSRGKEMQLNPTNVLQESLGV